ncbi:hypothetical protein DQK32_21835 [Salmonella enterica subsp. enterica serovar Newport]|uniref:Uncharacterized protein n=1 Tax=Salmonella newport TaxID=108619 RepID=A0A5U9VS78_SALNE|nr:hypothetical protein [Salmonella enterica subsp. enterica serovar Newport]
MKAKVGADTRSGYMLWGAGVAYNFSPLMACVNQEFGGGGEEDFRPRVLHAARLNDNNKRSYAGFPCTLYLQGSLNF